ncbi:TetR family transcriptional regulator [Nocardia uniformis]|uniref:TetR family transcriptional regulator n=1 Tax=Nocardia uniformis TaxID=53432 RepID=A0A849CF59_9NOCA|nr:TetR family transcriptional regulator [Nocardia uniformis]NNH74139.1 TetR family transcriptional regulator [Nocardia uniformis]
MGKRERTHALLQECALDLFERQGYEQTTVAQIAAAAGVTEMTFFRHFPVKHQALFDDPYDPMMAAAVAAQPRELSALARTVQGVGQIAARLPEVEHDLMRRRIRLIARTPALRGAMWRSTAETERLIADQLVADGADPLQAGVVAAAVLAGLTSALLSWADQERATLAETITAALAALEGS